MWTKQVNSPEGAKLKISHFHHFHTQKNPDYQGLILERYKY